MELNMYNHLKAYDKDTRRSQGQSDTQSRHHRTTHQASLACFVSGQAQHGFNFFLSSSVCFLLESVVVAADGMFNQITGAVEAVEEPKGQEETRARCVPENQTKFWFFCHQLFLLFSAFRTRIRSQLWLLLGPLVPHQGDSFPTPQIM